jgi:hypothetical protein
MAKLYQNRAGQYFTKSKIHGRVVTLQIADEGADFLHDIGIEIGDELGAVYWDLVDNHWIYTLGEFPGGGELDISDEWVRHDALSTISPEIRDVPKEPLTHLGNDELTTVPRFLYAPTNRSITPSCMLKTAAIRGWKSLFSLSITVRRSYFDAVLSLDRSLRKPDCVCSFYVGGVTLMKIDIIPSHCN